MAGALSRYHGARLVQARLGEAFPWGTFLINLTGSFGLGILAGLLGSHPEGGGKLVSLLLGVGFCGAYTTFSSFAWETLLLWRQGQARQAAANLLGQPILGGLAVWLGLVCGAAIS